MRSISLYLVMFFALISCKKETIKSEETISSKIIRCSEAQHLDSAAISTRLNGTWTWKQQSIPNTNKFKDADKNITVTFDTDSTFIIKENSNVVIQGSWKLIDYTSFYGLQTEPFNQYVYGAVYFCDNQLLFMDSYVDGPDNLFER